METFLFQSTLYLLALVIAVPIAARHRAGVGAGLSDCGYRHRPVCRAGRLRDRTIAAFRRIRRGDDAVPDRDGAGTQGPVGHARPAAGAGRLADWLATAVLVLLVALALGLRWRQALAVGVVLAMSSTAIVMQTLTEKGLTHDTGRARRPLRCC